MIVINNMEMPKCCNECKLLHNPLCDKWQNQSRYRLMSRRDHNCPLKQIDDIKGSNSLINEINLEIEYCNESNDYKRGLAQSIDIIEYFFGLKHLPRK